MQSLRALFIYGIDNDYWLLTRESKPYASNKTIEKNETLEILIIIIILIKLLLRKQKRRMENIRTDLLDVCLTRLFYPGRKKKELVFLALLYNWYCHTHTHVHCYVTSIHSIPCNRRFSTLEEILIIRSNRCNGIKSKQQLQNTLLCIYIHTYTQSDEEIFFLSVDVCIYIDRTTVYFSLLWYTMSDCIYLIV